MCQIQPQSRVPGGSARSARIVHKGDTSETSDHLVIPDTEQKDATSPAADLEDMQSLFFLVEDGDAYRRAGNLGMALKRYISVQKVFVVALDVAIIV
jgi:NMDA receptor-regulated protein 1